MCILVSTVSDPHLQAQIPLSWSSGWCAEGGYMPGGLVLVALS
jgi:hypothetical protein